MLICDHRSLQAFQGFILSLHASLVAVHGPPRLQFKLLKLLNVDFDADPDQNPAFTGSSSQNNVDRIRNPAKKTYPVPPLYAPSVHFALNKSGLENKIWKKLGVPGCGVKGRDFHFAGSTLLHIRAASPAAAKTRQY